MNKKIFLSLIFIFLVRSLVFAQGETDKLTTRFNELVEICGGEDMFLKEDAVVEFVQLGPDVVPKLIPLLENLNRDVRACAVEALGKSDDPRAAKPLITLLNTIGPHPKYAETFADTYLRNLTIQALGNLKDESAIPHLKKVIEGTDEKDGAYDRIFALNSLVQIGQKEYIPQIVGQLDHDNPDIRNIAAQKLGEIGDGSAVAPLMRKLKDDEKWFVRDSAAVSLGKLEDPSAKAALQTAAEQDTSPFVRRSAKNALEKIAK